MDDVTKTEVSIMADKLTVALGEDGLTYIYFSDKDGGVLSSALTMRSTVELAALCIKAAELHRQAQSERSVH